MAFFRTGTEEQKTERGRLIEEVIQIQEAEKVPIIEEIGAECDEVEDDKARRKIDKVIADKERDAILNKSCKYLKLLS